MTIPVLEIGGTHVTSALVRWRGTPTVTAQHRDHLDSSGSADEIVGSLIDVGRRLRYSASVWGVAIPGPFSYRRGVGEYEKVGKFDNLNGFDLGSSLREGLGASSVHFMNDADAFGVGEAIAGSARGHARAVCLTLGTGIGSAFIAEGYPVNEGASVPPDGSAHLLEWEGAPIENVVSRRAIRAAYEWQTGSAVDVHEIAMRARQGDQHARNVMAFTMEVLGAAIAPWVESFEASILVMGGSISQSWDLLEAPLRRGLYASHGIAGLSLAPAALLSAAPLIGAASLRNDSAGLSRS